MTNNTYPPAKKIEPSKGDQVIKTKYGNIIVKT